jgi:N-acetylmuramoyl-L-alanine amidase
MHLDLDSQKMHMNRVLFYTSLPIKSRENDPQIYVSQMDLVTLIDPILRPGSIKNAAPFRTVILDPGHGGKDKGAAGMEAAETLKLALAIKEELQNLGHIVVMTREENVFVPLEERVEIAKANPKAIMISLHFNSGPKDAQGIETYIMSAREPNAQNRASIALATAVHSRTMIYINGARGGKNFGMTDRGIRRAKFNILKHSPCPTILMEAGYLTNKEDAEKIKNPDFQKTLAAAVVRGVLVYKKSIQKR